MNSCKHTMLYFGLLTISLLVLNVCKAKIDSESNNLPQGSNVKMETERPTVIIMDRLTWKNAIRIRIIDLEGIQAVLIWLEENSDGSVASNVAGAVLPECTLTLTYTKKDTADLSKKIILYGQINRAGTRRAISASAFDDLWKIFERYGEPMENP